MMEQKGDFEKIFKQNERRCYYHIQKLCTEDLVQLVHWKGLHAMRHAHKLCQPNEGILATYFNIHIRDRMSKLLQDKTVQHHHTGIKKATRSKF